MQKKALILCGGWAGHDPVNIANRFAHSLREEGCSVTIMDNPDCFADALFLRGFDLIVPCWSYTGKNVLPDEYAVNIADAVSSGTGIAGCHGGMCDAFRESVLWQFLIGAQWVSHPSSPFFHCTPCIEPPEGVFFRDFLVHIVDRNSPITRDIPDFEVHTEEQYYLHVDPAIQVLATTEFVAIPGEYAPHLTDMRTVTMPVAYTRKWNMGKIFYLSLGHQDSFFERTPAAAEMMRRGLIWALR